MNDRTRIGLNVLGAALLLGLLGDALLRATPWGVNVLLWTGALAASLVALARQRRAALDGDGRWLLPAMVVFAAGFAWRDSLTLRFMDALAIMLAVALLAWRAQGGRIRLAGVADYALGLLVAGFNATFGVFPLLLADIEWKQIPRTGWSKHGLAVLRGLCLAVPLLLVFGGLFMAADAIFEGLVRDTLNLDIPVLVSHVVLVLFFAWVTGGLLRGMMLGGRWATGASGGASEFPRRARFDQERKHAERAQVCSTNATPNTTPPNAATPNTAQAASGTTAPNKFLSLGIVEIGIVLGLLDVLFLCFVAVQIQHYFHGAEWVMQTAGVTFSDYARRGFFELVWVATLVLPILLGAHWLLRKDERTPEIIFRVLAGVQIALLFVVMASAIGRMLMYARMYGLTELRFYTTAFMGWLGMVFRLVRADGVARAARAFRVRCAGRGLLRRRVAACAQPRRLHRSHQHQTRARRAELRRRLRGIPQRGCRARVNRTRCRP